MGNERKIGKYISIRMGIVMSAIMSCVGSLIGAFEGAKSSPMPFIVIWLPSFLLSFIIASIIAITIGAVIPMKKINDFIETKTKLHGLALNIIKSLVSDIIYTSILATILVFISTSVFALPNSKKGIQAEIEVQEQKKKEIDEVIEEYQNDISRISNENEVKLGEAIGESKGLENKIKNMKKEQANMKLVPMALKSLKKALVLNFYLH